MTPKIIPRLTITTRYAWQDSAGVLWVFAVVYVTMPGQWKRKGIAVLVKEGDQPCA